MSYHNIWTLSCFDLDPPQVFLGSPRRYAGIETFRQVAGLHRQKPPDPGIVSSELDIGVIAGVIAAMAFVLVGLLLLMLHYMYRHKGTYHTNEAKGTEFAESADVALQDDPSLQDNGGSSKKEYFI